MSVPFGCICENTECSFGFLVWHKLRSDHRKGMRLSHRISKTSSEWRIRGRYSSNRLFPMRLTLHPHLWSVRESKLFCVLQQGRIFRGWFDEHICASYITDILFIQTFTFFFCCQHLHHKCPGKPFSKYKLINKEEKMNLNVPSDVWSIWTVNSCEDCKTVVKGHSYSLTAFVFSISHPVKSQLLTVAQSLRVRNS